jgi:hypothetical protein
VKSFAGVKYKKMSFEPSHNILTDLGNLPLEDEDVKN